MKHIYKSSNVPIWAWVEGVPVDSKSIDQLKNIASLPFVYDHVAVMPDVHFGIGATVGSVIATKGAIVPAAVGVDIGCGMMAVKLKSSSKDLPDNLDNIRARLEGVIPKGFESNRDHINGSWITAPKSAELRWEVLAKEYNTITNKYPKIQHKNPHLQVGTLGGGNHFVELCLDENQNVWVMLHSGSRGAGNRIGQVFIELAKEEMIKQGISLPDKDLAFLTENTELYNDYCSAVHWAQRYAADNRLEMMDRILNILKLHINVEVDVNSIAINCHHNYVSDEVFNGNKVHVTRKGAVSAYRGQLGIIPGSMGTRSYIVRGLGNEESFCSCSHGAGRVMSRGEAKRSISVEDHIKATEGISCRKDESVLDESPAAYKNIDMVMEAQSDLVEIVHTLKQVLCIKG